ncbi:hypothetical protein [Candidatus Amarolinea dominans]|uniref:hypothetical protein n=1 Tax=Candidatus Amarolinea dominans TaxID=3140696 RepID=UPI003134E66F|nr:hypothetical protein [Anaerolineae bacterium]
MSFFPVVGGVSTAKLPKGVAHRTRAVTAQANSADALPALLPVGLKRAAARSTRSSRNAFDRVVLNGEAAGKVLAEEGRRSAGADERDRRGLLGARSTFHRPLPGDANESRLRPVADRPQARIGPSFWPLAERKPARGPQKHDQGAGQ